MVVRVGARTTAGRAAWARSRTGSPSLRAVPAPDGLCALRLLYAEELRQGSVAGGEGEPAEDARGHPAHRRRTRRRRRRPGGTGPATGTAYRRPHASRAHAASDRRPSHRDATAGRQRDSPSPRVRSGRSMLNPRRSRPLGLNCTKPPRPGIVRSCESMPLSWEKKCRMHILDDLTGLSSRAKSLLERTGRRDVPQEPRLSTEFLRIRDCFGQLIPTQMMLVIRREGFEQKYGGLRYQVRSSYTVEGERREVLRDWHYDLGQSMWTDAADGWYFDWFGERMSSPVRYLVHTDGRVGVDDGGGTFLEIARPSRRSSNPTLSPTRSRPGTAPPPRSTASHSPSNSTASPTSPKHLAAPSDGACPTTSRSRSSGTGAATRHVVGARSSGAEVNLADARLKRPLPE